MREYGMATASAATEDLVKVFPLRSSTTNEVKVIPLNAQELNERNRFLIRA